MSDSSDGCGASVTPEVPETGGSANQADSMTDDSARRPRGAGLIILAAMPFDESFDDVFFVAIRGAAEAIGAKAIRIDQVVHAGDAVDAMWNAVRECSVLVADVSTNEADVLYELGLAHAWGKPTVQLCSAAYSGLPFMIRNRETLPYQQGRTHLLKHRLSAYLRALIANESGGVG